MIHQLISITKFDYNSFDSIDLTINQIMRGRCGYVYLLKAEGTPRYKIGRSNNPLKRGQKITVQSPYPLTVVDRFWSPDCVTDEIFFHRKFSEYRVHGEYFEFPWIMEFADTELLSAMPRLMYLTRQANMYCGAYGSFILSQLAHSAGKFIVREYEKQASGDKFDVDTEAMHLFMGVKSIKHLEDIDKFVYNTIPFFIKIFYQKHCGQRSCKDYIAGIVRGFAYIKGGEND